ncbi:hypothetical protein GCM10011367_03240 [Marinicauda pacifica]|uniref:Uncharacterized protein n=1 Tax=Marinicauda pacifica TaxID=1133559 RepID=A0A4S2HEH5_9PROT|nr:hypothetical protein [Marinicauda pacifica]TGY94012.1 hypothetical protein E5162_01615 [Marinicauda pacifica]GGE32118.1 hypothetical protein GCM10011367_03240 [Marinicauda pacifica]
MSSDRITIQVESNIGEDGPLTVTDTLDQFRDAFELLTVAIAQEAGGEKIKWRLESLSKNSPATVTGVGYSPDPEVPVIPLMQTGKQRFSRDMAALREGKVAPWIQERASTAKSLFKRNLNGIGRTVFDFDDDLPRTVFIEKFARSSLEALNRVEALLVEDRSHSEHGALDGHVTETKTWNGRPAVYVKDRLTGRLVPCVLSDELANKVGSAHSWSDAWNGQRVRVRGRLFYDKSGVISRIQATDLQDVTSSPVDFKALRKINILEGRSPTQHLDEIWGYNDD